MNTNRLIVNTFRNSKGSLIKELPFVYPKRCYPAPIKRFYLNASVSKNDNGFEVQLDKRPVRTPGRKPLTFKDEKLANAVAVEWCSQKQFVAPNVMHLTALSNTVQDNPMKKCKDDLINSTIDAISMDTILYRAEENDRLSALQRMKWDPICNWFRDEFQLALPLASGVTPPLIPRESLKNFRRFLEANDLEAIQGFVFGVDAIRSVILTTATVKYIITPKEAVHLSRLELEFQAERWGNVEWHHEMELHDSIARLSAAALFFDSYT